MQTRRLVQPLALNLGIIFVTLMLVPDSTHAEQVPAACSADTLVATSAEVQGATGGLAGTIYIYGSRAMPPCTLQGTLTIQILDANGNVLPISQVGAPGQGETTGPVVLGKAGLTTIASVFITWRNFCQTPIPPGPYSLKITFPDGSSPRLALRLLAKGPEWNPQPITAPPRCDAPMAPSTLAVGSFQPSLPTVVHDDRYFAQTSCRIDNYAIWDYFNRHGGLATFGYPVSRTFRLRGFLVQFFQRRIVQVDEHGRAWLLNVLDSGLMPFTSFNGAIVPAVDNGLVALAPSPTDASATLAFVKDHAPDRFQGMPVNFYQTFVNTVSYQVAFPKGGDPSLLPGIDLEMWGLPTSAPAFDPNNHNFVYLRFQRGIMHYDAASNRTQGILLADYLKAILTGKNLPADLHMAARSSMLYQQYDPNALNWVHNPGLLPNTDLTGALEEE